MAKLEVVTRYFMEWSPIKVQSIPVTATPVEGDGEINCIKRHPIDMRSQGRNQIGYFNEIRILIEGRVYLINWNELQDIE